MQRNWASPRFWSDTQLISALPVQSKIPQFSCGNCAGCSDLWRRLWCWRQCGRCCGQWWPPCPLPACPRPPARRWWCACCPLAPPTSAASDRYRPGRSDLPQSYKMKQYRTGIRFTKIGKLLEVHTMKSSVAGRDFWVGSGFRIRSNKTIEKRK